MAASRSWASFSSATSVGLMSTSSLPVNVRRVSSASCRSCIASRVLRNDAVMPPMRDLPVEPSFVGHWFRVGFPEIFVDRLTEGGEALDLFGEAAGLRQLSCDGGEIRQRRDVKAISHGDGFRGRNRCGGRRRRRRWRRDRGIPDTPALDALEQAHGVLVGRHSYEVELGAIVCDQRFRRGMHCPETPLVHAPYFVLFRGVLLDLTAHLRAELRDERRGICDA